MDIEKLLQTLGLDNEYEHQGDKVVVHLKDSDQWMKLYNKLSKSDFADLDVDTGVQLDMDKWSAVFLTDDYDLTLLGDVDKDEYNLIIKSA